MAYLCGSGSASFLRFQFRFWLSLQLSEGLTGVGEAASKMSAVFLIIILIKYQ